MFVMNRLSFTISLFFFKQKTAYEMRISDWSSDVCSSDLDQGWRDRSAPDQWSRKECDLSPYHAGRRRAARCHPQAFWARFWSDLIDRPYRTHLHAQNRSPTEAPLARRSSN